MNRLRSILCFVLLSGCGGIVSFEPYYSGGPAPKVSGIDVATEEGNIGGGTVVISGSNFGSDPTAVTVVFGSQNAEVVAVDDSSITVVVPRGPVEGGSVDVRVGTAQGQVKASNLYTYDVSLGEGDFYEDQVAYIAVTNDYYSCLGGAGDIDNWAEQGLPCDDSFVFTGLTGIEGRSELLEFAFPRVHSMYTGYRGGFGGAHDFSWNRWTVEIPPQDVVTIDFEQLYDDLRVEVDNFTLVNTALEQLPPDVAAIDGDDEDEQIDGRKWCADESALASYAFEGAEGVNEDGQPYSPFTVKGSFGEPVDCPSDGRFVYDLAELQFCQPDEYESTRAYYYEPEWPIGEYFFYGEDEEGKLSNFHPANVRINVPEAGISGVEVSLPPFTRFYGSEGFNQDALFRSATPDTYSLWAMTGFDDRCVDSNGDSVTSGDDIAAVLEWEPSAFPLTELNDQVKGARTYVRINLSWAGLGWLGGEGVVMKATITVPDEYNVYTQAEEDGGARRSRIEIPASLVYQFPSARQDIGSNGDSFQWGDPARTDYGFILMTAERITEYAIAAPGLSAKNGKGNLVFAYSTGDLGYLVYGIGPDGYASWYNPSDLGNTCGDCADSDGDGWLDSLDPDCGSGTEEDNSTFGGSSCNDGIDNDGDALIDAEDPACTSGRDSESNCEDGEDNDGDGWEDGADPECARIGGGVDPNGNELGFGTDTCNDGEDNDGDGLFDGDDESCESATDFESNCGDGEDNDGDALVDLEDPECLSETPLESEFDIVTPNCEDDSDNDSDGWVDAEDPDCVTALSMERGFGSSGCNDGVDNDGQGDVDRDDISCQRSGAEGSEQPAFAASCVDGRDNDGDGYEDGNDPDCELPPFTTERYPSMPAGVVEQVPACYNGLDDDGDGDADSADADCVSALGDPSGWILAEDPLAPGCSNGVDDDADGWSDLADPDCVGGAEELGLGSAACNDGSDNDGDLLIDALDPDCTDAADGDEAP